MLLCTSFAPLNLFFIVMPLSVNNKMLSNSFAWSSFSFTTVSETMRNVVTNADSCDTHLFVRV